MKRIQQSITLTLTNTFMLICTGSAFAESEEQRQLRTDEAETSEAMTEQPLKAAMQNLFLQEDPFPQQPLQVQVGLRVNGLDLTHDAGLSTSVAAELGLADSWTLSVRAPAQLWPGAERGIGNTELGALYSLWVSKHEDLRLSVNLRNVLPSPSRAGKNAFAHDLNVIGYARWAPLHVQAVATLDLSYGHAMPDGPRIRPELSAAAILKLEELAIVLEAAAQREFSEVRYVGACGLFAYPGAFELGAAATLDVTNVPLAWGAIGIVSYAFDPPT